MSLTAFFLPEEVTTTSTTVEWTHPTYTTFEIPPLPPVYVVSCNESLLPEPPKGQGWNCTKPGRRAFGVWRTMVCFVKARLQENPPAPQSFVDCGKKVGCGIRPTGSSCGWLFRVPQLIRYLSSMTSGSTITPPSQTRFLFPRTWNLVDEGLDFPQTLLLSRRRPGMPSHV